MVDLSTESMGKRFITRCGKIATLESYVQHLQTPFPAIVLIGDQHVRVTRYGRKISPDFDSDYDVIGAVQLPLLVLKHSNPML